MNETTVLEISKNFKKLLVENNILSQEKVAECAEKSLNLYTRNNKTPSINLLGINFSNYVKLAEVLLASGIDEKVIIGKKKEENSNALLNVNHVEKVYSKKAITSISRRLLLSEELMTSAPTQGW